MEQKKITVREVRERLGITQQELADRLGMARPYLASVEIGKRNLSSKLQKRLQELLTSASISVIGNSGPVAVGSPGASLGGASPPGEGALSARVEALEARVAALERALVATLAKEP